jgi:hypothetical protein
MAAIESKYGTTDERGRDDGSFTASQDIYLDADGNLADGVPEGGRLLVASGKKLTTAAARHHGLLDDGPKPKAKPARKPARRKAEPDAASDVEPDPEPDAES